MIQSSLPHLVFYTLNAVVIIHEDVCILIIKMSFSMHVSCSLHSQAVELRLPVTGLGSREKKPFLKLQCLDKANMTLDQECEGTLTTNTGYRK